MALIQVTPELLRSEAQKLRGIKSNHDNEMTAMKNLIMGLNEIWKGQAQDAFVAKFEGMQSTFTSFSEMIEEYAALMDQSANALEQVDAELAGANK